MNVCPGEGVAYDSYYNETDRVNNYMKNCLHTWQANLDIQPTLSSHAVIEYILSYVTKGQKGMSIQMERACKEAKNGNMDLKRSV